MKPNQRKFLQLFFGNKKAQSFFSKLHRFALYGQYYGIGAFVEDSGERNVLALLNKVPSADRDKIILDVGANRGEYALDVFRFVSGPKKVYAFEPVPSTFEKLKENVKHNAHIFPYCLGISAKTEKLTIYKSAKESKHASLYPRNMDHWDKDYSLNESEEVSLIALNEWASRENISHIDLLKMDAEGHEFSILSGAEDWLKGQKIDLIQFEFGVCNVDSKVFFKDFFFLLNGNYKIFRILKNDFVEIKKYDELLEVFLTTNYLAVSHVFYARNKNLF